VGQKHLLSTGVDLLKAAAMDKDLGIFFAFLLHGIEGFPCQRLVEIPRQLQMEIFAVLMSYDPEIGFHHVVLLFRFSPPEPLSGIPVACPI
jgi:hypothetical protein